MTKISRVEFFDVAEPQNIEVEYNAADHTLYVHVDGVTLIRVCRIPMHGLSLKGLKVSKE